MKSSAPPPSTEAASRPARELWGTKWGFVLAAVGSAVGLGNMWRFSYVAAEGGGAAFVLLYILMILLLGIPLMLCELSVGRGTHLSPIGALRSVGGRKWVPLGFLFVASGFLILSYYSVIAGWTLRYALESVTTGFAADPGAHFEQVSEGGDAIGWHLFFMVLTIAIVMGGIQKGIERAALVLMPTLFLIVAALAVWAFTLEGAGEGYAYYLRPDMSELFSGSTLQHAASQAFFSLSLGMGAMLTFASYLSRDTDLTQESVTISFADFLVAFTAGLVVFPVIYALGLQESVTESTVGALFISLPGAFEAMGGLGRIVGLFFFVALAVGAVTSAISLLEVVTASFMDEFGMARGKAAIGVGIVIALFGVLSAMSTDVLGLMDQLAGNLFLVAGGLGMAVLVGWVMKDPAAELTKGASDRLRGLIPGMLLLVRYVLPPAIALVLWFSLVDAWGVVTTFMAG